MSAATSLSPPPLPDRLDARPVKAATAFRTISEVADELDVAQHVLRFWETKFPQVHPLKRGGGRRYYRPEDVDLLRRIRSLLYEEGYTIKGVQKVLRVRRRGEDEPDAPAPRARVAAVPKPVAQPAVPIAEAAPPPQPGVTVEAVPPSIAIETLLELRAELAAMAEIAERLRQAIEPPRRANPRR